MFATIAVMKVLVFGDSITQGYWDTEGGWVNRIRKHYDELQVHDLRGRDDPVIFNLGVSGDTSEKLLQRIEYETIARQGLLSSTLPVVVVQIGINDSLTENGKVWVPLEKYSDNLLTIITKLNPISSKVIFVGFNSVDESETNPTFWGDFNYQNETIKKYEDAIADVARMQKVPFIPIFNKFKAAVEHGNDFLPDGLHPNNVGHAFIAGIVQPELDKVLD